MLTLAEFVECYLTRHKIVLFDFFQVVQCQVADSLDGEQRPVNYPLNLRGRFELVDETSTDISTRDLFRKELPVCVQVVKYDASIGFDPLKMKQHFQVVRIVSGKHNVNKINFSYERCSWPFDFAFAS